MPLPELWKRISPADVGIPVIDRKHHFYPVLPNGKPAKVCTWVKKQVIDPTVDYYLVKSGRYELRLYREAGGTMDKCIIHNFVDDDDGINALWRPLYRRRRMDFFHSEGVRYFVAPDFTATGNMAVAHAFFNLYRSMVVTRDFVEEGFKCVPLFVFTGPARWRLEALTYGTDVPYGIVDLNHLRKDRMNQKLIWSGAKLFAKLQPRCFVWLYAGITHVEERWRRLCGTPARFLPSQTALARLAAEAVKKARKGRTQEQSDGES